MTDLHPIISQHPDWAAFDVEEGRAHKLMAKASEHNAKRDAKRRKWEEASTAYEAELLAAALEERDPDPSIKSPGEWREPTPLLGRRVPAEVVHQRITEVQAMRHTWTKRKAPELVPGLVAEDARLVGRLRSKVAELSTDLAEVEGVRASLDYIRAREVKVPRPTPLFEVQNILAALENALQRAVSADQVPAVDTFGGIPLNLDDIDIQAV